MKMLKTQRRLSDQLTGKNSAPFFVLMLFTAILAGCAAGGGQVASETAVKAVSQTDGVTITALADGRRGFVINEVANLSAETRHNFEQAVTFLENRDYEQAIELFEDVVETAPGVTAPYIDLAIAYMKVDKSDAAEDELKIALKLVPGHPVASHEYGLLLRRAGRFTEARSIYEQALEKFPDYLPVRKNLGILCDLYLQDPECAVAQYEQYSAIRAEDKQVRLWISELRLRQKK